MATLENVLSEVRNVEEALQKLNTAELEQVREVSKNILPESVRAAVKQAAAQVGGRFSVKGAYGMISAAKQLRKDSELRKRLRAMFLQGQPAGRTGVVEDFHAIGRLTDFVQDYIVTVQLSGTELQVQSARSDAPFVADTVSETAPKPYRPQQLATNPSTITKIAATTSLSEEAFRVYGDTVIDYLALQLTIDVYEYLDRVLMLAISASGVPFNPAPFAGYTGSPAPNVIDLLYAMYYQESETVVYNTARSRDEDFVVLINPRDYYSAVRLRDGVNRPLYRDWEEAFPLAPVIKAPPLGESQVPRGVAIFRPRRYFLGVLDDLVIYSDRVSPVPLSNGRVQDTNLHYVTVELLVTLSFTLRADTSSANVGYSRFVTNATPIIPTL